VKKVLVYLLIVISAMSMIGCGKQQPAAVPAKTITIGIMPDVESIPFLLADKNGYFAKEGVQVKIVPFKSAKDRDSALQSGQLDGMVSDILAVVFASEGGINLKICAKTEGNIQLLGGKDSGIKSIADLKGKNIGLSTNTIMEYSTDRMLEAGNINSADVKKVAIPQIPTRLEMLQGGKVDAAIMVEPYAGLGIKNGATVLNSTDNMKNKPGAITFTAQSLKDNPNEIKAVFKAYNDSVEYMKTEPLANYIDYIIQAQGFPAEIKDSLKLPQYSKAELPSEAIFNDVVKWLKDKNLIKGSYQYKDLVDDQVLR
jgi:NitT/TauT family transport system substrate-binding protein